MLQACFFDLDGTLINSIEDLAYATNVALEGCGVPTRSLDEYYHIVGNGVVNQIKRALGTHLDDFDRCLKLFQDYYRKHCYDRTMAYEGMKDVVKMLHDHHVLVVCITNKPDFMAKEIVSHIYGDDVDVVIGGQEGIPIKPDPESTNMVIKEYGLDLDQCVFIGDTYVDIETGHNANMRTIGCLWGFRDRKELENAGADIIVESPKELGALLYDWYERMF